MVINPAGQNVGAAVRSGGGREVGSDRSASAMDDRSQSPIMTPGLLDQGQVRSRLRSSGFSGISNLRRDGTTYVGTADWYGEPVDLRVDGRNGFVIEPSHLTPSQVRTMLDEEGWSNVARIDREDTSYRVRASRNGTPYNLWIDARTGEIDRQSPGSG
jgi:hypothetical protein